MKRTFMFKKTIIAASIFSCATFSQAASFAPSCQQGKISMPCNQSKWDLGIWGLYLTPEQNTQQISNDNYSAHAGWGFRIEGSYHTSPARDITVNWTYFDQSTGNANTLGYMKPTYHIVNLELGQQAQFGRFVDVRFLGGLQYINLKQFAVDTGNINTTTTQYLKGLGVRGGLDSAFNVTNNFALTAGAAVSVLVAQDRFTLFNTNNDGVVTGIETKAGGKYTHKMQQGDLSLEAGYQMANYNTTRNSGDVGLHGIYLGVKWVGQA